MEFRWIFDGVSISVFVLYWKKLNTEYDPVYVELFNKSFSYSIAKLILINRYFGGIIKRPGIPGCRTTFVIIPNNKKLLDVSGYRKSRAGKHGLMYKKAKG